MDDSLAKIMDLEARVKALESRSHARTGKLGPAMTNFERLLALRGLWMPGESIDNAGAVYDRSGQGRTLTFHGNPVITYVPGSAFTYMHFDGVGDYLERASEAGLNVTGTETYVLTGGPALKGLTVGGWFRLDDVSTNQTMMSKRTIAGNQSSWFIRVNASFISITISADGLNETNVNSTVTPTAGPWYFIVGRYSTAAKLLAIFVNGVKTETSVAQASIFSSTAPFEIGARDAGALSNFIGGCSVAFLCSAIISDDILARLFATTRSIFGV